MSPLDKTTSKETNQVADGPKSSEQPIKYAQVDGTLAETAHDKAYMELTLNSGNHSDLVKKILRQRIEKRAQEYPRWPASETGGVRALWIESRFWYDRERFLPDFDDDWRKYRARYLHSLNLDPREPVHVPEFERMMIHPIRRLYMKPGDWIESGLKKVFKMNRWESANYRVVITRHFLMYLGFIGIYYYYTWHHSTWMGRAGWEFMFAAPEVTKGHPKFPFKNFRTESFHHYDEEFSRRNIYRDLRDYEDKHVPQ